MPAKPGTKPLKELKPGMGLYQVMKGHGCPTDKPWAVVNLETGDVNGRCHVSREGGLAQAKALYARLGDKAKVHTEGVKNAYFFSADPAALFDGTAQGVKWVEAMAPKSYSTVGYGEVEITPEQIDNYIHNINNDARGQEIAIDYEHGLDKAKGNKAAGWIRGARKNQKGNLELAIEFTEPAKQEILNKEWKYFSLEWDDEWEHPDGVIFRDVVMGGALTNRPVAKGLMPINFSEVFTETAEIEVVGEQKELEHSDPGTGTPPAPRTSEDGSDDPAIRGGWRRELPPAVVDPDYVPGSNANTIVTNGGTTGAGTGANPPLITTPNIPKGGNNVPTMFEIPEKDAQELLRALDLPVDADGVKVVETVKLKFGELDEMRKREATKDQEKAFAEKYPQYWSEHKKLTEKMRENDALMFTESVSRIRKAEGYGLKETKQGLSPQAKEKVVEVHKKFSEGNATLEDFEECIKEITNGGIVQFGEIGSTGDDDTLPEIDTNSATGVAASRKLFGEVVAKIQKEHDDWDYMKCVDEAAKKHPDLYDAYQVALPA